MSSINFTTYATENGSQKDEMYDNFTFEDWNITEFILENYKLFNVTNNKLSHSENKEIPNYLKVTIITCYIVIMCLGVIGNAMVPIVILKSEDMRNSTNIFLVNLSIADLMFLLICLPISMLEVNFHYQTWLLGKELCLAFPFLELMSSHVSVLTILALSFERYYAICQPFKAGYVCTNKRAAVICVLVWFFAAICTGPMLFSTNFYYVNNDDGSEVPVCVTASNSSWFYWFFIVANVVFFIGPLGILIVVYSFIAKNLMKNSAIITQATNNTNNTSNVTKYKKQVILMLGTVVISFFVCFLPFNVLQLLVIVSGWNIISEALAKNGLNIEEIVYYCRVMVYCQSAINPILYNLISTKFRKGFVTLLRINKLSCKNSREIAKSRDTLNTITSFEL